MRTFILVAVALLLDTAVVAQLPVEAHPRPQELLPSTDPALAANKKLVFDFWRVVLQGHHVDRAPEYLAEGYVQHNPNVATGRAAFMEFFGRFPPEPVKEQIDDLVSSSRRACRREAPSRLRTAPESRSRRRELARQP